MIARNRIWEEMKQAKSNIICLQKYTDKGRRNLRIFNVLIITLPTLGALCGGIFDNIIYAITGASATALTAALKSILPNLTQSEQELSELDRLMDFYSKYMNNLEKLWYNYDKDFITEKEMINKLFEIKEDECDRYSLLNKGVRSISKKEKYTIENDCTEYINRVYFIKTDENN